MVPRRESMRHSERTDRWERRSPDGFSEIEEMSSSEICVDRSDGDNSVSDKGRLHWRYICGWITSILKWLQNESTRTNVLYAG